MFLFIKEPVLFSGSVKENILYGAPEGRRVNDDDLDRVLREANAYDFVYKDLPKGVNTVVGERGIMLSGGQKQRIAIARALIKVFYELNIHLILLLLIFRLFHHKKKKS